MSGGIDDDPSRDLDLPDDPAADADEDDDEPAEVVAHHRAVTTPGYMERAILADIETFGEGAMVGRSAYVAMAVSLARVVDRSADEVGVTAMAKAADSLRSIMDILSRPRGDESNDLLDQLLARMSSPVGYEQDA